MFSTSMISLDIDYYSRAIKKKQTTQLNTFVITAQVDYNNNLRAVLKYLSILRKFHVMDWRYSGRVLALQKQNLDWICGTTYGFLCVELGVSLEFKVEGSPESLWVWINK